MKRPGRPKKKASGKPLRGASWKIWVCQYLSKHPRTGFGAKQFLGLGRIYKEELRDPQSVLHTPSFQASVQAAQQAARDGQPSSRSGPSSKRSFSEVEVLGGSNSVEVFWSKKQTGRAHSWKSALVKPLRQAIAVSRTRDAVADQAAMTRLRAWSDSRPAPQNIFCGTPSALPLTAPGTSQHEHFHWTLCAPTVAQAICRTNPMSNVAKA